MDCYSLGFPPIEPGEPPVFTLGILAVGCGDRTQWFPVRGTVRGANRVRAVVPSNTIAQPDKRVSICLGVPAAALTNAVLHWLDRSQRGSIRTDTRSETVPVSRIDGRTVPAESEVVLSGRISDLEIRPSTDSVETMWELPIDAAVVDIDVETVCHRDSPLVPFAPLGSPLTDDIHLVGITEAARLSYRVKDYWGIAPVEWIRLPAEMGLGTCVVASEILYAGFEWQLANTLFSFSNLFDKVLILDEDTPAADLARPLNDMWVKAHPSQDWVFSESSAPAATAPQYRTDGEPGSRLFINATWDPRCCLLYTSPSPRD